MCVGCLPFLGALSRLLHLVPHGHLLTNSCIQWLGYETRAVRNGNIRFSAFNVTFSTCSELCRLSNALLDVSTMHCEPWVSRLWFFMAKKCSEMTNRSLIVGIFHKVCTALCSSLCQEQWVMVLHTRTQNTHTHTCLMTTCSLPGSAPCCPQLWRRGHLCEVSVTHFSALYWRLRPFLPLVLLPFFSLILSHFTDKCKVYQHSRLLLCPSSAS